MLEIRFLGHSGFAVRTDDACFVFDDAQATAFSGKNSGGFSPEEVEGRAVFVFASHRHEDHFNPEIFHFRSRFPDAQFILSGDIPTDQPAVILRGGETTAMEGTEVTALTSTDEGVGFLVKRKGQCLYHAGDLHWWHWEGELKEENRAMARRYWEQIDRLRGETIDVAFLPADPRQGEAGLWGLRYFLRTVGAKTAAPMHCWGDERWMDRIAADPLLAGFRNRLLLMRREGDCVRLEKNKSGEHIFFPSKM